MGGGGGATFEAEGAMCVGRAGGRAVRVGRIKS